MKTLKAEYPWFESLMEAIIVDSKETRRKAKDSNKKSDKLAHLGESDGYMLGRMYLHELKSAATEEGGFDRWVKKFPAMKVFSKNHNFFRSLLISIGKEIKHRGTWDKLVRSLAAAVMSLFDVGTDVYTILYYNSIGEGETATYMAVFVILSLSLQTLLCIVIHRRNRRRMLIEIVGTWTFTKPAFNKWRVLTNAQMQGHEVAPPVSEMMMFKAAEVFAESIPITVLQVYTVLTSTLASE